MADATVDLAAVWDQIRERLVTSLSPQQNAMLNLTRPIGVFEDTAVLSAPNEFTQTVLESRMRRVLAEALSEQLGRDIRVAVQVEDSPAELGGERLGQLHPHPRLEDGLGELVGRGEHRGVLDQAQRTGQVEHRVLLRGQAGREPLADLVPDRRQVDRGVGHRLCPFPCLLSSLRELCRASSADPGCESVHRPGAAGGPGRVPVRSRAVDSRTRSFHTSVHSVCTPGDRAPAPRRRRPWVGAFWLVGARTGRSWDGPAVG